MKHVNTRPQFVVETLWQKKTKNKAGGTQTPPHSSEWPALESPPKMQGGRIQLVLANRISRTSSQSETVRSVTYASLGSITPATSLSQKLLTPNY